MDTGVMIAVLIIGLYICAGPFILLGLYILFDSLAERGPSARPVKDIREKDPSLWTTADVDEYLARQSRMKDLAEIGKSGLKRME